MATIETLEKIQKQKSEKTINVKVSAVSRKKAAQLERFLRYSSAKSAWGKDQKLLHCNLLLVPTAKNYTVLLAMGRDKK